MVRRRHRRHIHREHDRFQWSKTTTTGPEQRRLYKRLPISQAGEERGPTVRGQRHAEHEENTKQLPGTGSMTCD
ncbi:hypothetical protein EYF80_030725 [Liparis tanakae]|uniref:Uncharacterized protein n=1 Tax=Liparis tanakae TaxID=230148 RepID=A0A4Z2H0G6_9TELE|nr:hypothetical protein EYF80_030725 [Liparis tanakae]